MRGSWTSRLRNRVGKIGQGLLSGVIFVLAFFRLLDEHAQLSLTNIAVMIVLWKLWQVQVLDMMGVASLLTVLSTYTLKRYVQRAKHICDEGNKQDDRLD